MLLGNAKQTIERELAVLVDEKVGNIYRAGNMLTLGFGKDIECIKSSGEIRLLARFALHIQTSWRITMKEQIVLGSYDFCIPHVGITYEAFLKDEDYGFGKSVFDKKASELNEDLFSTSIKVKRIISNDRGDLCIFFENDIKLEVFVNCSEQKESWRFIDLQSESHFVVFEDPEL